MNKVSININDTIYLILNNRVFVYVIGEVSCRNCDIINLCKNNTTAYTICGDFMLNIDSIKFYGIPNFSVIEGNGVFKNIRVSLFLSSVFKRFM
jgi:hypothetical protein